MFRERVGSVFSTAGDLALSVWFFFLPVFNSFRGTTVVPLEAASRGEALTAVCSAMAQEMPDSKFTIEVITAMHMTLQEAEAEARPGESVTVGIGVNNSGKRYSFRVTFPASGPGQRPGGEGPHA
jgi:hypothetical protein